MTTLVEEIEPIDGLFDGFADGEEAVVAKKSGTLVAEGLSDIVAFVFGEDDAFAVEDDMILMVSACHNDSVQDRVCYIVEDGRFQ